MSDSDQSTAIAKPMSQWLHLGLTVILALTSQLWSTQANAGRTSHTEYYTVLASNISEAAEQIQRDGPRGFAAYTNYTLNYSYRTSASNGGCRLSSYNIELETTYTMPRWENVTSASESSQQAWTQFYDALWRHEQNHGAIGDAAYSKLTTAFSRVGKRANCSEFDGLLEGIFNQIDSESDRENAAYDARTSHGQSEGAVLTATVTTAAESTGAPVASQADGRRYWYWWFIGIIVILIVLKRH